MDYEQEAKQTTKLSAIDEWVTGVVLGGSVAGSFERSAVTYIGPEAAKRVKRVVSALSSSVFVIGFLSGAVIF